MKRALLFPLLLIALSGCDDFHHVRYRHLEKVPASGIVAAHDFSPEEPVTPPPAASALPKDSVTLSSPQKTSSAEKQQSPSRETKRAITKKHFTAAIPQQFTSPNKTGRTTPAAAAPGPGLALFLSVILFLLGGLLIIYGISLLVIGIVFGTPVIIAFGVLCLLYGGRPVWAVVRALFSRRKHPDPSER